MKPLELQAGQVFGKLTIIEKSDVIGSNNRTMYLVQCECGSKKFVAGTSLKRGDCRSCGCAKVDGHGNRRHGKYKSSTYNSWKYIRRIAKEESIDIDPKWAKFENFYADCGDRPEENLQLSRIDTEKGFFKDNCRWMSIAEARAGINKMLSLYHPESGELETGNMTYFSVKYGIKYQQLQYRLARGWELARALEIK
jgi:hypothetical protein